MWPGNVAFVTIGAGFGYWMDGVEKRQRETVQQLRDKLVASRELRAQRQAIAQAASDAMYEDLEKKTREAAE